MDETRTLKRQVDAFLRSLAPSVHFRKNWGGGSFGHEGDWDYTLCGWGRFGVLEIKHPVKRPPLRPSQIYYGERIKAAGGFTIVAYSLMDVVNELAKISSEELANEQRP